MNTFIKKVPILAFLVAAVFAFAFTQPTASNMVEFGTEDGITWYVIDENATQGVDYECNLTSEPIHCLYESPDQTEGIPVGPIQREFVLLNPNLPVAN
ncbi:MAG: hypothetical protein ACXIUD_07325 [Mongoliitalea sp.]